MNTPLKLAAVVLATLTSVSSANANKYSEPPPAAPRAEPNPAYLVRAKLATLRAVQIQRLTAYSNTGVFPRNRATTGLINIFKDEDGHLCAAANLIALSGDRALVDKTAAADNFIRLVDVKKGALLDWMLTSGLTIDEIDRIQEPYMGSDEPSIPEPTIIASERQRLQAHFTRVLAELRRNTRASLDLATAEVLAHPELVARVLAMK